MNIKIANNIVKQIQNEFALTNSNCELEFRFGKKSKTFNPHISYNHFNLLRNRLGKNFKYIEKKVNIYYNYRTVNGIPEKKVKMNNIDFHLNHYDIRFSKSIESCVNIIIPEENYLFTRNKKIWIYSFDYYDIEFTKFNINAKEIFQPIKFILSIINEYQNIVSEFNTIFNKRFNTLFYPINKPKNLKKHHINTLKDNYVYFDKLDGVRYLLFESKLGTYLINQTNFIKINDNIHLKNNILDVEYTDKINLFDILIYNNQDVRFQSFFDRYSLLNDFEYNIIKYNTDYENITYSDDCDGIIFTPINNVYKNSNTYKYKPLDQLTIDFKVNNNSLEVIDNDGNLIHFSDCDDTFDKYNNTIIECKWDNKFIPYRIRDDKINPNYIKVAEDVMDDIKNPFDLNDIKKIIFPNKC